MNRLLFLSYNEYPENVYIPPHQHACYEIVYYFHGNGSTQIGSTGHRFKSNHFAVISPHTLHDERHSAESKLVFLGFLSDKLPLSSVNSVFPDDERQTIAQYMLRMKHEYTVRPDGYSDVLDLMVGELTTQLLRISGVRQFSKPNQDNLKYIVNYMDEHYRQKITVEMLADMSGYSYDRFRHLFKEKFDVSPHNYLLLRRLEYAKMLLLHSTMTVSEIALESGFVNNSQFCTIFKRETGLTPKTFRKQLHPERSE